MMGVNITRVRTLAIVLMTVKSLDSFVPDIDLFDSQPRFLSDHLLPSVMYVSSVHAIFALIPSLRPGFLQSQSVFNAFKIPLVDDDDDDDDGDDDDGDDDEDGDDDDDDSDDDDNDDDDYDDDDDETTATTIRRRWKMKMTTIANEKEQEKKHVRPCHV